MGRYKSVEIKGLFFQRFNEIFEDSLITAMKNSELSETEFFNKLAPKFSELISAYRDDVAKLYLQHHRFKLNTFLKSHFATQKKTATIHQRSFIPFFLYINGCAILYEKASKQISRKRVDSTLKMNLALYGLIVRRADQIGNLLLSGYIDGAMIIWRSLYENSIILLLLAIENDPNLSDKFYLHSVRNSQRKASSYSKHYKDLKFKPLSKSTQKNLNSKSEYLSKKYGKDFLDNEFGWADNLFPGKQKASFRLLEDRVEMSRYRPFYLWCCEQIHTSFNSFSNFMEDKKIILPKLLDQNINLRSLVDPMQFTISILHDINDYILYEFSCEDEYEANLLLMRKIFEEQQKTF